MAGPGKKQAARAKRAPRKPTAGTPSAPRKRTAGATPAPRGRAVASKGAPRSVADAPTSVVTEVGELAWTGKHAAAIDRATRALADPGLPVAMQLDLLDLRAESCIARGDIDAANADASLMLDLARRARKPAFLAQALNRRALIETRRSEARLAVDTASEAIKAARKAKSPLLEAMGLHRLAEAQFRQRMNGQAAKTGAQAVQLFRKLKAPVGEGRAWWAISAARSGQGRVVEADRAATQALTLARRTGDLYGAGNALNMLTFNESDIVTTKRLLQQSLAAFEAAGYLERQGVIIHNLANVYGALGLHRRSRRFLSQAIDIYRPARATGLATTLWVLSALESELGHAEAARASAVESVALAEATKDRRHKAYRPLSTGRLALEDGEFAKAIPLLAEGAGILRDLEADALYISTLVLLARAQLAAGDASGALITTETATAVHRAHDLASMEGMDAHELWWRHSQALAATGKAAAAQRALATAYRFVLESIATLSDEGLRRNALNKVRAPREIIEAWIAHLRKRKQTVASKIPHLAGKTSLSEPFERLADTGLRLNELRNAAELHEFLIDEATELSGGERVLLVLEIAARTAACRLTGAPRRGSAGAAHSRSRRCSRRPAARDRQASTTRPSAPSKSTSARASSRR